MLKKELVVRAATGLHARPAANFVELASRYDSEIKVHFGDKEVNAKSIISVLSLGLGQGESFVLTVEGPDEKEALTELEKYIQEELNGEKERSK